jgi:hypothetical protein
MGQAAVYRVLAVAVAMPCRDTPYLRYLESEIKIIAPSEGTVESDGYIHITELVPLVVAACVMSHSLQKYVYSPSSVS